MWVRAWLTGMVVAGGLAAQVPAPAAAVSPAAVSPAAAPAAATPAAGGFRKADAAASSDYTVATGSKIALSLINSVSTKHSVEGDRVYLETVFPVLVDGRIVVPVGSYVAGTVTQIKKPGRVKGRGELYVRFDSLTLPNGVTRDFRARMGGMDGATSSEVDRKEGKVTAAGNKKGDLQTIGEAASSGAAAGGLIGGLGAGHPGLGVGIGAGAGAAAGMIGVLLSRGPDAVLDKGTTVEMVLDRPISFTDAEINFGSYQPPRQIYVTQPSSSGQSGSSVPAPHVPFPF